MRIRPWLLALGLGLAATLTVTMAGVATAHPSHPSIRQVPTDQPLPGYTIDNAPLTPVTAGGSLTRVLQGVHDHAAYTAEVPAHWNGDLVIWAHGYRGNGTVLTTEVPAYALRQRFLDQGYAWASSSYYDNGFDIRSGVVSSHDLAEVFGRLVHRPHRTFLAGVSMGGYVIGRSLEQYPGYYSGALPMCGVLGDQTLMDYFLSYNLVAQDLAGVSAYPVPVDYLSTAVPRIEVTLGLAGLTPTGPDTTNALGKQLRAITINLSGGPRPGAEASFAVWKDFLFGISVPTSADPSPAAQPGQIAENTSTVYSPNSPVDINATVRRVEPVLPHQRNSPFLTQVPKIFGLPTAPVVTLHGLGDLFVPFANEQAYQKDVSRFHLDRLVVQRAIRTAQHCEFSPAEAGSAWDDLVTWTRTGHRPAGDDVTTAATVADPAYGCQFSDRAAYAVGTGTRRLYAACPAP